MESHSLTVLATELLSAAKTASNGRGARTIYGGRDHALRQTLMALTAGRGLAEHQSPGEATLQVLVGRVRLTAGCDSWEGSAGDYVHIPPDRHSLDAIDDAVIVLTVVVTVDGRA